MIIQNNFNSRGAFNNNSYTNIGKGKDDINRNVDNNSNRFIEENKNNNIVKSVLQKDHEYNVDDDNNKDKWDFFR